MDENKQVTGEEQQVQQPKVVEEPQTEKEIEYYPPTTQEYQYKIFINQCNGFIGSQLVELFRNDDQIEVNPNCIIATTDPTVKYQGQLGVDHVIDINDKNLVNAVAKQSDIIVFVLREGNEQHLEYLCKILRRMRCGNTDGSEEHKNRINKKFIVISSCVSWNKGRKNLDVNPCLSNFASRNSTNTYLMELENLCLDINNYTCGIDSYVVCAGLVYGYGEDQLFSYFKRALEQSQPLNIYGKGTNKIPMIHLEDLCNTVKDIAFQGYVGNKKRQHLKLPSSNYYFAVDQSKITQAQLIKAIAETLGNGAVESLPIQKSFLRPNFEKMTIDMKIQDIPSLRQWHCKQGIIHNFSSIVSQFNTYRGLKPNKIVVSGPPVSGKSKIAQNLASAYGLPILTIKRVVQDIKKEQGEFANTIKVKLQEIRTLQIEEERKAFEEAKKKKKGKKDAGDEFDPEKVVPRLPQEDLIAVFKHRMSKSDCQNKGYILDGWPKTLKSCQALFLDENSNIIEESFPNSCFFIEATEDEVKERLKNFAAEIKETTHWNEESTARRFQTYTKNNEEGSVKSFFQGKVDIKSIAFDYEGSAQFVEFVQRNGPLGFKKKEKKVEEQKGQEKGEGSEQKKQEEENRDGQQDLEDEESQEKQDIEDDGQFDLEKLTEHQKQILNEKSRPIRQYLIDNVIPQITQGLLQICKDTPKDPIAFLIKFLENKELLKASKS